jgi:hypothetical protein
MGSQEIYFNGIENSPKPLFVQKRGAKTGTNW